MTQAEIKLWQDNLLKAIKDVSDLEWQKSAWRGQLSNTVSSFSEVICTLYDDLSFEDYISYMSGSIIYDNNLLLKLKEFNCMLNEYITLDISDEEILEDANWHIITAKAEELMSIW